MLLLCLICAGGIAFGDVPDTIPHDTTALILEETTEQTEVQLLSEEEQHRYNRRYQVGSALAMMLFVGILIGSVQTFNPK